MAVPAGVGRATLSGALKRLYPDDKTYSLLNENVQVVRDFQTAGQSISVGEKWALNLEDGLSDAGRHGADWADLPIPRQVDHKFAFFGMTTYRRTIRVSGQSMRWGGVTVDTLIDEVEGSMRAGRLDREDSFFVPKSGKRATIVSASSATSVIIDNYQLLPVAKTMYLSVLKNSTGSHEGVGADSVKVTSFTVSKTTGQATLTLASPGVADWSTLNTNASDYGVYRTGEYGSESFGFPDIISESNPDTGNYGEIDRSTDESWKAIVTSNGSASIDVEPIVSMLTDLETSRFGGDPIDLIYCHHFVWNDLMSLLRTSKRAGMSETTMKPWGRVIIINDIPITKVRHCGFADMWFINRSQWRVVHPKKGGGDTLHGQWLRSGGEDGTRLQLVPGKDGVQAAYVSDYENVCWKPGNQGLLNAIAWSPTGTVSV